MLRRFSMKKLLAIFAVVLFLFAWSGFSDAMMCNKSMGKGKGMADEHPMFEKLKSLGLDEKQMGEVKAVHFTVMKETIKKRADMQVARVELREILDQDPVDVKAAEAKIRQIEGLSGDIEIIHIKAHEEVKSRLTPEQRKKFAAMMPMMHGGMMGNMMGNMKCECGRKGKMKKCRKCGVRGKGMMNSDDDDDMFSGDQHDHAGEMPSMDHQHMHHGQ
jgi:Spy/CpxP family protein refolding chaperone